MARGEEGEDWPGGEGDVVGAYVRGGDHPGRALCNGAASAFHQRETRRPALDGCLIGGAHLSDCQ